MDSADIDMGLPTCWDEWFPEVARNYGLRGADLLCYPTAIGSEPDHPDFNTRPLWQSVIVGHSIANGLFIAVPNRTGMEGLIRFYGGSFIADPFGRILVEAPEDEEVALVAEIDLSHRQDWLQLFPFFATRRPDTYAKLTDPVTTPDSPTGRGQWGLSPAFQSSETITMWTMPPEWQPHTATWMGFPTGAYDTAGVSDDDVFDAWAQVANTISEHEPVHMLCHPGQLTIAQRN